MGCGAVLGVPPWEGGCLWAERGARCRWCAARRSPSQNRIVDRCERLQLQSAAIARHVGEGLPAKDRGVLVGPCPFSRRGEAPWAPLLARAAELSGGSSVCRGSPPPTRHLVQVEKNT